MISFQYFIRKTREFRFDRVSQNLAKLFPPIHHSECMSKTAQYYECSLCFNWINHSPTIMLPVKHWFMIHFPINPRNVKHITKMFLSPRFLPLCLSLSLLLSPWVFSQLHFPNTAQTEHAKHTAQKEKGDTWVRSLQVHFANLPQLPPLIRVETWPPPLLLHLHALEEPYLIFFHSMNLLLNL